MPHAANDDSDPADLTRLHTNMFKKIFKLVPASTSKCALHEAHALVDYCVKLSGSDAIFYSVKSNRL